MMSQTVASQHDSKPVLLKHLYWNNFKFFFFLETIFMLIEQVVADFENKINIKNDFGKTWF